MCGTTDPVALDLPRSLEAPAHARDLVEQYLCREHARAALAAAQLLVSELATCAVLYGDPPITLRLECRVTQLGISVTHRAQGSLAEIPIDEEDGLRSAILGKLSRSWGVERDDDARTLWCSLATGSLPTRPVSSSRRSAAVVSVAIPAEAPLSRDAGQEV